MTMETNEKAVSPMEADSRVKVGSMDGGDEEEAWGSRMSFILAAVGAAIGLGNFWRFPYYAFKWGGGSFFIPYLVALMVVGIPLAQLECSLGQVFRVSAPLAYGKLDRRAKGVGLAMGWLSFVTVGYYAAILAWGNVYLVQSFYADIPWSINGLTGNDTIDVPFNHFRNNVLQVQDEDNLGHTSIISSSVFAGAFFMWASVLAFLWKGADFISKAVWVTVLTPVAMLIVLLVVGLTLEGSDEGITQYIGRWNLDQLQNGEMWSDAFGQVFFSIGLSTGILTAYSSLNKRNANIVMDASAIVILNFGFSFIAGFAVFTVAGYLAQESGLGFSDKLSDKLVGTSLAFVTYPAALTLVADNAWANVLNIMFFVTIYMLGVDSMFALTEAVVYSFREMRLFQSYTRLQMTILSISILGVTTTLYTADIGFFMLDAVDDFIGGIGLVSVGFAEVIVAGWVYKRQEVVDKVGGAAMMAHEIGYGGGFLVFTFLSLGLAYVPNPMEKGPIVGISVGLGIFILVTGEIIAYTLAKNHSETPGTDLWFHQTDTLRATLNGPITEGKPNNWTLNRVWGFIIKFITPPFLFFLVINRAAIRIDAPYGSYPLGYQLAGISTVAFAFGFIVLGWFKPHLIEPTNNLKM